MMGALWMYYWKTLGQACLQMWSGSVAVSWKLHRMELEPSFAVMFCAAWALGPPSRVVVILLAQL